MEKRKESIADQTVMQFNWHDRKKDENGRKGSSLYVYTCVYVRIFVCVYNSRGKEERACDRDIREYMSKRV